MFYDIHGTFLPTKSAFTIFLSFGKRLQRGQSPINVTASLRTSFFSIHSFGGDFGSVVLLLQSFLFYDTSVVFPVLCQQKIWFFKNPRAPAPPPKKTKTQHTTVTMRTTYRCCLLLLPFDGKSFLLLACEKLLRAREDPETNACTAVWDRIT